LRNKASGRGGGEAPEKKCPNCGDSLPLSAGECECGWLFAREPEPRHGDKAGEQELLQANAPPQTWQVEVVKACKWINKKSGSVTLRVDYDCAPINGGNMRELVSEWVCLEHPGFAGIKAQKWWKERCEYHLPTISEAVLLFDAGAVKLPRSITTRREGRFWRVLGYELEEALNPDAQPGDAIDDGPTPLDDWAGRQTDGAATGADDFMDIPF
jgi:DNA repair protein RadD